MTQQSSGVEERLRRLEDLEEIEALFLTYRRALDDKDFAACGQLFTPDGVFGAGEIRVTGPLEVQRLLEGMLGNLLTDRRGEDLHLVSNVEIEVDGDRASATSTWTYIVRDSDGNPRLLKNGHYEDVVVRENGRWRFAERLAPTDIPVP